MKRICKYEFCVKFMYVNCNMLLHDVLINDALLYGIFVIIIVVVVVVVVIINLTQNINIEYRPGFIKK